MIGDTRQRFCGDCKMNVYNLSGMTKQEAENLIVNAEGRLCVRFFRRADGTVLTKDCPVGWAAVKRRVTRISAALASLLFGILAGIGMNAFFSREERQVMGSMVPANTRPLMGDIAEPTDYQPEVGKIAVQPKGTNGKDVMGEMVVPVTPVKITRNR
jgi:hypothetical protein